MEQAHWATLEVAMRTGRIERDELAAASDRMQDLAALLAMETGVSGVETRDPSIAPVERPLLVVYTEPAHLDVVEARTRALAASMALEVTLRSEVRQDEDWKDAWKAHYRPLLFGQRQLLLRPSWIERRPEDPDLEVVLDPGRAFGTGLHESTALCLDRLCALQREHRPDRGGVKHVLDLGCGSGILVLAALRLWPNTITVAHAIDIDPEAIATTVENAGFNALGDRVTTTVGTLDAVGDETFDLLIANIRPEVLIPIAAALRQRARPGAAVVLSGILAEEADSVAAAFTEAGWHSAGPRRDRGEWVGLDYCAP